LRTRAACAQNLMMLNLEIRRNLFLRSRDIPLGEVKQLLARWARMAMTSTDSHEVGTSGEGRGTSRDGFCEHRRLLVATGSCNRTARFGLPSPRHESSRDAAEISSTHRTCPGGFARFSTAPHRRRQCAACACAGNLPARLPSRLVHPRCRPACRRGQRHAGPVQATCSIEPLSLRRAVLAPGGRPKVSHPSAGLPQDIRFLPASAVPPRGTLFLRG